MSSPNPEKLLAPSIRIANPAPGTPLGRQCVIRGTYNQSFAPAPLLCPTITLSLRTKDGPKGFEVCIVNIRESDTSWWALVRMPVLSVPYSITAKIEGGTEDAQISELTQQANLIIGHNVGPDPLPTKLKFDLTHCVADTTVRVFAYKTPGTVFTAEIGGAQPHSTADFTNDEISTGTGHTILMELWKGTNIVGAAWLTNRTVS